MKKIKDTQKKTPIQFTKVQILNTRPLHSMAVNFASPIKVGFYYDSPVRYTSKLFYITYFILKTDLLLQMFFKMVVIVHLAIYVLLCTRSLVEE
jgi:hypothetical protein